MLILYHHKTLSGVQQWLTTTDIFNKFLLTYYLALTNPDQVNTFTSLLHFSPSNRKVFSPFLYNKLLVTVILVTQRNDSMWFQCWANHRSASQVPFLANVTIQILLFTRLSHCILNMSSATKRRLCTRVTIQCIAKVTVLGWLMFGMSAVVLINSCSNAA